MAVIKWLISTPLLICGVIAVEGLNAQEYTVYTSLCDDGLLCLLVLRSAYCVCAYIQAFMFYSYVKAALKQCHFPGYLKRSKSDFQSYESHSI